MVEIKDIIPNSIAAELGIGRGDRIISVNGRKINDALDFKYHIASEEVELLLQRGEERFLYEIEKDYDDNLGLILEELEMRSCGNSCLFCFVYQNPKGLRKSLYFKDEDYRFSFLYGHYTTLTNATREDLQRIVEQHLSPLYISVHVTEPEMRKMLLGIKFDDHLFEKIDFLTANGIELNCQIVLCPGLNDGENLDRTIRDLKAYYPMIRSIAIVPLGLTKHRKNLFEFTPVTNEYSVQTIVEIDEKRKQLKKELGSSFVYLSDEFFIRTNTPIPGSDYYEGFYQLENGVGLTRDFMMRFDREFPMLKDGFDHQLHLTLVTGVLGSQVLNRYFIDKLNQIPGLKFDIQMVLNDFYGHSIVVSGLLVGRDIYHTLKARETGRYIVLPPNCLNDDGVFLDDWTPDDLRKRLDKDIFVFSGSFVKLLEEIREYEAAISNHSG